MTALKYNSTTTLRRIREGSPESGRACKRGYTKLIKTLGKTKGDDGPVTVLQVLDSNGLNDAIWVLSYAMPDDRLARHFQAWCAEQVLHLFEAEFPGDMRVRDQIAMLRNDSATEEQREVARAAALAAAGRALWGASQAAAGGALWAAKAAAGGVEAAPGDAVWAAQTVAQAAGGEAATGAGHDARVAQEAQLRKMLEEHT